MNDNQVQVFHQNSTILANAAELAAQVVVQASGEGRYNQINGQELTLDAVRSIAIARFQNNLKIKSNA